MENKEFIIEIIAQICDYAVRNGIKPNDTLETIARSILGLLEISNFDKWKEREK